ncbi:MAG TPA: peptidase M61 [Ignavibacteria bacterium]|nr:peptidase M61 [Ignavibacteria bacterium]
MKLLKPLFVLCLTFYSLNSYTLENFSKADSLKVTEARIDLKKATGDHRLFVEVKAPRINSETIEYHFPKIVPGTYAIYNFGRYVSELKAYDGNNSELAVVRKDTNIWSISGASGLDHISYIVKDSYHSDDKPIVFEPAGSCIDSGKAFVLNNFCFVGYFEGFKDDPFNLVIDKPAGFFGSTSLPLVSTNESTDIYTAKNYFQLHDNPILYCVPDTATMTVNNTKILVSIYSPNKKVNVEYLKEDTRKLFTAQGEYLGGSLPAKHYSVLVYLFESLPLSGSTGALEHFTSTVMTNLEVENSVFIDPFNYVIAHEFFHIVTPLSIHSKEIHYFDFNAPKMSKHLWLYEGSTEYYAQHFQVKTSLINTEEFLRRMRKKVLYSKLIYNDTLSFTELSKGALSIYKPQYGNVYQKGALLNMCLDLYLLKLSDGKYGLQNLKRDLVNKYGPDKPFEDDELFGVITALTYPEIGDFLKKYVEGSNRLPLNDFLNPAGFEYLEQAEVETIEVLGGTIKLDNNGTICIADLTEFGKKLKMKKDDIPVSINGEMISAANIENLLLNPGKYAKPGDVITTVVMRKNKNGDLVKKTLTAKTHLVKKTETHVIRPVANPNESQIKIRKAWINR